MWSRGLVGLRADTTLAYCHNPVLNYTGVFAEGYTLPTQDLVFATLRRVGVSVLALKKEGQDLLQVSRVSLRKLQVAKLYFEGKPTRLRSCSNIPKGT